MRLEFVGQTTRNKDFPTGGTSRLINGYREPMVAGGRSANILRAVPGMQSFADLPTVFSRGAVVYDDKILTVAGDRLFSIAADGSTMNLGDVQATDDIVGMTVSTGKVCIAADREYWTWDGATLANPTTGAVTAPASVAYLGGYVLVSQYQSRVFAWSNLAVPGTFSGSDFASAEITDEDITQLVTFKDALYIFKYGGFERWAVTGQAGVNAFARIDGAQGEPGLLGYNLVTTFPNGMAWIGSDGRAHVLGIGPISTPPLEVAIATDGPRRLFFYEHRGHGFICITFEDGPAWCYDVATGEWHERMQNDGPWQASLSVKLGTDWYLGTEAAKYAKLGPSCNDFGLPMIRRYVSNTLEMDDRVVIAKIEAFTRPAGDIQGDGTPAKVSLRTSRDGLSWGAVKDREVGLTGEHDARLVWRALGQFRKAVVELSQTSFTDVPMLSTLEVEIG